MPDVEKGYTPRRVREQRAFRAAQVGSLAAVGTVGTLILAVVGVLTWWIPVLLAVVTFVCLRAFRSATGR